MTEQQDNLLPILAVAALGVGAYFYLKKKKEEPPIEVVSAQIKSFTIIP